MQEASFKSEGTEKALGSERNAGQVERIRIWTIISNTRMQRQDFIGLYNGVTDAT